MLKKPMKAPSVGITESELKALTYPIICSPKIDGIRGVITSDGVMSNSLKPIGNRYIQASLMDDSLVGLDGELVVGSPFSDPTIPDDDVFNRTSGSVRRSSGTPDFTFWVFDRFTQKDKSYNFRWLRWINLVGLNLIAGVPRVELLEQVSIPNFEAALRYEATLLAMGYEGMMVRAPMAPYKEGRSTLKQGHILKRKPIGQDEAVIVDAFEQLENQNEKTKNELGNSTRSAHKENKVGKDTLGGFVVKSPLWKETFNIGTIIGGTAEWRKKTWEQWKTNPDSIKGQLMTYLYQEIGSIDKPRQPRGKAEFRDPSDIS